MSAEGTSRVVPCHAREDAKQCEGGRRGVGGVYEEVMQNHCFHLESGPVATFNGIGTLGL